MKNMEPASMVPKVVGSIDVSEFAVVISLEDP
jgi:hypothetical protein